MRFGLAYCNQSVCAPSRNNLLLGSRSTSLGIYDLGRNFRTAAPNAVTVTQHFMQHRWRAESVGNILHTGHGNHDDQASWSVPPLKEKVVEYLDPRNSANGWHLGDHGYWTKHTTYEQASHIPLIIVAPGVTKPGNATNQLAETVDIFPTLAELAGLPAPGGPQRIDGLSLVPVLRDSAQRIRDHAYHCFPRGERMGRAIRTEHYRLVEWKVPGAEANTADLELYDYQNDPAETKNLAATETRIVAQLQSILARHPEAEPPQTNKPNEKPTR